MLDIESLYLQNGVHIASHGERHYRQGWINTPCPFCTGNPGNHLGWNINQQYFICIRCGWHPVEQVLPKLLRNTESLKEILREYAVRTIHIKQEDRKAHAIACILPSHQKLNKHARAYLRGRRFNPTKLEYLWDLKSGMDGMSAMGRIIAPIYIQGRLVSYQTRDITGKAKLRYVTCSMEDEVIHHKHILYGSDQASTDTVVVVEGITDVWRLGFGAVATLGIKYTQYQVMALSRYNHIRILFDTVDPQARKQGKKLAMELATLCDDVEYIELTGKYRKCDPALLPQAYATSLMHELKG